MLRQKRSALQFTTPWCDNLTLSESLFSPATFLVLCGTFWYFLYFLAFFLGIIAAMPLRNSYCCNEPTQFDANIFTDGAYPSPLTSMLTMFEAVLGALHTISSKVFSCLVFLVVPFIRIVSDLRMSSSQQKETCASQKLSCIIRIFWSVKKDGNCNFSENIFPGFIISPFFSNILLWKSIGKCDFTFVQSNVLMRNENLYLRQRKLLHRCNLQ